MMRLERMSVFRQLFAAATLLLCGAGCSTYEYDLTRPAELATHIAQKSPTTVRREPLNYRFTAEESRLVVEIENPTDSAIQLLGDRSSVVDFNGQSHPLQSRSAAPHSFVKVILPPLRPVIERTGPTFGIGVGTVVGTRGRYNRGLNDDPLLYGSGESIEPRYLNVYDGDDSVYWDWSGQGEIRIAFTFAKENSDTFTQEFVIARRKKS